MMSPNESPTLTPEQQALVKIAELIDEMMTKLALVQARSVRIETRVSKIAIRLGLTYEGESPGNDQTTGFRPFEVKVERPDVSVTP